MKIKGKTPPTPKGKTVTFPREEGDIEIKIRPVMDYETQFEAIYPEIKPPVRTEKDGSKTVLYDDPKFLERDATRDKRLTYWLIYASLEEVEFDNVDVSNVETLDNVRTELMSALVAGEFQYLVGEIQTVNLPSPEIIKDTIEAFAQARHLRE